VNVAHPKNIVLAAAAALLAQLPAGAARAADPAPSPGQTVVVGEFTSGETKVILVEQIPKKPWETPAWAYPDRGLTFFPDGPGKGKDRWAIGGIWQIAPMFTASYTRGLGSGFSVDARLKTIIMLNDLGVGAQWAARWGPFSLGLMAHVDGFFGTIGKVMMSTEFNSTGWGVLFEPGAKVGLQVSGDTWLTLMFESYLSLYQATNLGGLVVSPDAAMWEGYGFTLVAEYSPKKQGVIYYGVSLYSTRSNYPVFFNVDYSSKHIVYLGLLAGYEF
jgi:hypothetical protein